MAKHDKEYSMACQGDTMHYGVPRVKMSMTNDGRAPDTTKANLPEAFLKKPKKAGRPRNARNVAPSGRDIVDLSHAIPWEYRYETAQQTHVYATNTCAMDTVLMGLYFLRKFEQDMYKFAVDELKGAFRR